MPHDVGAVAAVKSEPFTLKVFISHAVPTSIVDAMARNEILQIVVFSIFLGCSPPRLVKSRAYREGSGFTGTRDAEADGLRHAVCTIDRFAAISGLIAERGLGVMVSAGIFMGEFYLTTGMLWAILIGLSTMIVGPCIARLTKSILEPALLAFTTSSSEAAFPGTTDKLEKFGVSSKSPASFCLSVTPLTGRLHGVLLICHRLYCSGVQH